MKKSKKIITFLTIFALIGLNNIRLDWNGYYRSFRMF